MSGKAVLGYPAFGELSGIGPDGVAARTAQIPKLTVQSRPRCGGRLFRYRQREIIRSDVNDLAGWRQMQCAVRGAGIDKEEAMSDPSGPRFREACPDDAHAIARLHADS